MIYKCKNCGQNYYEKPDFCECGNDVFIIINSANNTNSGVEEKYKEDFDILYPQDEFVEQNDNFNDEDNSKILIVFASVVLIMSIILSSFFIYKAVIYQPSFNEKNIVNKNISNENIPNIHSYWDNSLASTNNRSANINSNKIANIENIIFETPKINTEKFSTNVEVKQKNPINKINTNSVKQSQNKTDNVKKEVKQIKETSEKKNVENIKSQENDNKTTKNTNSVTNKNIQSNEIVEDLQKKNNDAAVIKTKEQEENAIFMQYKADLRLRLFQHFPILNVFGSGVAVIGFNISSDGKLNNRRFVQQSDNKSLNDALYHMLMSVPVYSPPPKNYKGEDIVLKMEFNNGYYSFSFVE